MAQTIKPPAHQPNPAEGDVPGSVIDGAIPADLVGLESRVTTPEDSKVDTRHQPPQTPPPPPTTTSPLPGEGESGDSGKGRDPGWKEGRDFPMPGDETGSDGGGNGGDKEGKGEDTPESPKSKPGVLRKLLLAGALVVGAAGIGSAVTTAVNGQGSGEAPATPQDPTEQPTPEVEQPEATPSTPPAGETPTTEDTLAPPESTPENSNTFTVEEFDPSEPFHTVQLESGQEAKVNDLPTSLDPKNPEEVESFMKKVLNYKALGLTTGDSTLLNRLTDNSTTKDGILRMRANDEWLLPLYNSSVDAKSWRVSIFGSETDPPEFEVKSSYSNPRTGFEDPGNQGNIYIELSGGDLRMNSWLEYLEPEPEWGAPRTHQLDYPYGRGYERLVVQVQNPTADAKVGFIVWTVV